MEPFNWNVIIVGAWNIAILTPDGVRRRLFRLPDDHPIEVEMAVDRPGAYRVVHEGIVVSPTSSALEIAGRECTLQHLKGAAEIGARAVGALPETPMTAVGVNIRYRTDNLPPPLSELFEAKVDDVLSDMGLRIAAWTARRSIEFGAGLINLEVGEARDGACQIGLNFHRESLVGEEICQWLGRVEEFSGKAQKLLDALGCEVGHKGG